MHRLRRDTQAETRRLLRVLFLRLGSLPAGPGRAFGRDGRRLLRRRIAIITSNIVRSAHDWLRSPRTSLLAWGSLGSPLSRPVRARPCSNDYLNHCTELDSNGVHSQCAAVRTRTLPLHRQHGLGPDPPPELFVQSLMVSLPNHDRMRRADRFPLALGKAREAEQLAFLEAQEQIPKLSGSFSGTCTSGANCPQALFFQRLAVPVSPGPQNALRSPPTRAA
jgi:hypothetical protein